MAAESTLPHHQVGLAGMSALTAVAYVLCDLLHELGHLAATLLPLGVKAVAISTIGLSSTGSSAVVAAAGPLVNLVLSLGLLVALVPAISATWRYFGWLLGTVNLFNAAAYLLYSAILGSGDWATVFNVIAPSSVWWPGLAVAGLISYGGSVHLSLVALRSLVRTGVLSRANVSRYCTGSYWVGGCLLTAGAALNPVSPLFILTSGAATGFGAMVGLLLLPPLLNIRSVVGREGETLRVGTSWLAAGAVAVVVFIGVFGPGLTLA